MTSPTVPTPPNVPEIDLAAVLPRMQTGDLLLFHCDAVESQVIDAVTDSWFSHVAMVYRDPQAGGLYLWQTDPGVIVADQMGTLYTRQRPPDGPMHSGAQLGDLVDAITTTARTWGDQPFWRPMTSPRPAGWDATVLESMFRLDARPYPSDIEMALDFLLGRDDQPSPIPAMFCSEMIAATFIDLGVLDTVHPANFYAPHDFSTEPGATLPLSAGVTFGAEMKVIMPTPPVDSGCG